MATRKPPAKKKPTQAEIAKLYKKIGMEPPKTARQYKAEKMKEAKALPCEVRRTFWMAMLEGSTIREAKDLAGIKDHLVAFLLIELCHRKVVHYIPLRVEEIV